MSKFEKNYLENQLLMIIGVKFHVAICHLIETMKKILFDKIYPHKTAR